MVWFQKLPTSNPYSYHQHKKNIGIMSYFVDEYDEIKHEESF